MKRILILCVALCAMISGFAQDSTKTEKPDTIKIGGMVIIREPGSKEEEIHNKTIHIHNRNRYKESNLSTNWWIFDIGFSNWTDNTNYASAETQAFAPGSTEDWFKLRTGKSRNINIWVVMQRLNLVKHIVNLKYGLGLELNNYFFEDKTVQFNKNPTKVTQTYDENLTKNKLAADYLTMPLMLNFNFTPKRRNNESFGLSAGISAGYLYSARQKIKFDGDVDKVKGNFDLRDIKLSYVAELTMGPVRLYGSYATQSMFEKGLDLTPFNVGLRINNW